MQLQSASKLYGNFAALRKVTAEFLRSQCYVILGPNGAGKSTLLRVIAGLIRPTFGTVAVLGSRDISAVRHRIGYLSHASMLYDEMTALENLRYSVSLYTANDTDRDKDGRRDLTPEQALDLVGLDAKLDRPVGKFSQGMRQRAALARVLMAEPELLLLDEPFSNVDLASSAQMLRVLSQLRESGRTILLTTHQPELARPLADHFCIMDAGEIVKTEALHEEGGPP